MEGFGAKSCENMGKAIEKSKKVHPVNFMYALCIPMIGTDAAKKIVNSVGFDGFINRMEQGIGFEDVDGIGVEKSNSVLQWYAKESNQNILKDLLSVVEIEVIEKKNAGEGRCAGITFVITGDVHEFKNRDEFKAYVEAQGGKVAGSVSGKTGYLVNNDVESTSSKNKKAKDLGVPIISEDTFIEMFGR
jgi:DNA ligase (NAD+)